MASDSRAAATGGNRPAAPRPLARPARPPRAVPPPPQVVEAARRTTGCQPFAFDPESLGDPQQVSRLIGQIDTHISALLDAILHHPRFQKLEALWRSLRFLIDSTPRGANVRIRI